MRRVRGGAFEEAREGLLGPEGAVRGPVDDAPFGSEGEGRESGEAAAAASGWEVEEGVGGAGHVVGVAAV